MAGQRATRFNDILELIRGLGLLLETDNAFPSLATTMVGGPISGSWCAHPMANEIYMMSREIARHEEVLVAKLLSGKSTYVHSRLWPSLIAIATAREAWQLDGLHAYALALLDAAEERGRMTIDEFDGSRSRKETGAYARALESRLLVFGDDVHSPSGAHVKRIETWEHWAWRRGFPDSVLPAPEEARSEFDSIVARLNANFFADARLPWNSRQPGRTRERTPSRTAPGTTAQD